MRVFIQGNNGNLLNNGVNTYVYEAANRLSTVHSPSSTANYAYNGDGDRLQQTTSSVQINYVMDLNADLTQVLDDGTNQYIYGNGRIAQVGSSTQYFLGDALGSVRQLTSASGAVTLAQSYDPYGVNTTSSGAATSTFGYISEQTDSYIKLINLRSRMYNPATGRFLTQDSWQGDYNRPLSLNQWNYTEANPVNFIDPTGRWRCSGKMMCEEWVNNALSRLQASGKTGLKLVQYFHDYDAVVKNLNQIDLDGLKAQWNMQSMGIPLTQCWWEAEGLWIHFEANVPGGSEANTINPRELVINTNFIAQGSIPIPNDWDVTTFGHEISHYKQGWDRFSVQGEIFSQYVGIQIWLDLGLSFNDLHKVYSIGANLATGGSVLPPFPYNPFTLDGLKAVQKFLGGSYIAQPIWLGGLSESWLTKFSVNWYKKESWYLEYQSSNGKKGPK